MVVAEVGVGEDIVADRLAEAKPAAMADHQPCFGPEHRNMVTDRLGIGRADADVDQGHAVALVSHEVVGWHLVTAPGAGRNLRLGIVEVTALEPPARDRERGELAVGIAQCVDRETDEFIDVADIVGEQHEMLEMLGRGAGVMLEPRQAEVGARAVEQGQGPALGGRAVEHTIGNLVANVRELGRGEPARDLGGAQAAKLKLAAVEHVGVADFAFGAAN